jgi:hypothetical protein
MVPMVGLERLVSHLLLLRRQAGVEQLERSNKTSVIVGAHLGKLLAQLETLHHVHIAPVLRGGTRLLAHYRNLIAPPCAGDGSNFAQMRSSLPLDRPPRCAKL